MRGLCEAENGRKGKLLAQGNDVSIQLQRTRLVTIGSWQSYKEEMTTPGLNAATLIVTEQGAGEQEWPGHHPGVDAGKHRRTRKNTSRSLTP